MAAAFVILGFFVLLGAAALLGWCADTRDPEYSFGRVIAPWAASDGESR